MIYPFDIHVKLYGNAEYGDIKLASRQVQAHNLLMCGWQYVFDYFTIFPCLMLNQEIVLNFN